MKCAIGVDLGGSFIKFGVVCENGRLRDFRKVRTPEGREFGDVIGAIVFQVREMMKAHPIDCIGVASPGSVTADGTVIFSPNFPSWKRVELRKVLGEKLGMRITVDNDANAFAFGEKEVGCAQGVDDFILLTLGTGVGGAVFSGGRFVRGSMGIGAELGHILVGERGPVCGCGNIGCLETYASASGIAKLAEDEGLSEKQRTPIEILRLYRKGDLGALKVVEKAVKYLERALISFVHIFNPKLIVFGGGLSKGWREILCDLQDRVNSKVMPSFRGSFKIKFSSLHEEAGVLGIALMALKGER